MSAGQSAAGAKAAAVILHTDLQPKYCQPLEYKYCPPTISLWMDVDLNPAQTSSFERCKT